MPEIPRALPRTRLTELLEALKSKKRKVSRVVSFGGKIPRGPLSSRKSKKPEFQSLVEDDCLRVIEIATMVSSFETHPLVLELEDGQGSTYTPDVLVWMEDQGALFEIKPESRLDSKEVSARLRHVTEHLRRQGIPLVLMLDSDARQDDLQTALKELQRIRPARGRMREDVDPNAWDPLSHSIAQPDVLDRWKNAQRICDELLLRVMRRNPDDLLPAMSE